MLKQELVDIYKKVKQSQSLTYSGLVKGTGLTRSQIALILKNNGKGVSLDKMEEGLSKLGIEIEIVFIKK